LKPLTGWGDPVAELSRTGVSAEAGTAMSKAPRNLATWGTFAVTLVFLYLSFRKTDFGELGEAISSSNVLLIAIAAGLNLVAMAIRSFKLRIVFSPVKPMSFARAFSATMICFAVSNVFPLRAGEAAKVYVINKTEQLGYGRTIGAAGFDRILEAVGLFIVTVTVLLLADAPGWLRAAGLAVSGFGVFMFFLTLVGVKSIGRLEEQAEKDGLLSRLANLVRLMVLGAGAIKSPAVLAKALLVGLVLWNVHALVVLLTLEAFGLPAGYLFSFVLLIAVNALLMLPSGPATLGPFEYGCILSLALVGVGKAEALSFALVYHMLQIVPVTVIGLLFLWREGLTLRGAKRLKLAEFEQAARKEFEAEGPRGR